MASGNPTMNVDIFNRAGHAASASDVMTVQGTVLKTSLLVGIMLATASYSWSQLAAGQGFITGLATAGSIGGFVLALVTCFWPTVSPYTSPVYAACQGLFLGALSVIFNTMYPGIAFQAMSLSMGVLAMMLFLYGTRIIRVTDQLRMGIVAATGAICLVYLVGFVMSFFGASIPYIHGSGWIGIGFSLFVVGIAAFNLLLDFDFIEQGAAQQAPKYMEWYGGFSLLVTLVWMYIEILRLLAKLQNSRD